MNVTQRTPHELLASARAGRADCLGELLQRYASYLTILSSAQLDHKLRGRVSPSDVVQETYVEAHRDFPQFRGETELEFAAWLRQILVQNLARAVERHVLAAKRDVRREKSMEELQRAVARSSARLEEFLADRGTTPSTAMNERQRALDVADRLDQLRKDYRDVVVLRNFQGLSFDEVGARMGRSSGAARMLWVRALAELKLLLGDLEA